MPQSKSRPSVKGSIEQWAERQKLRWAARCLLINIAVHCNDRGRSDVSDETLARDTGYTVRTVKKIVRELEVQGLLRRHGCGFGRARDLITLNLQGDATLSDDRQSGQGYAESGSA